MFFHRNSDSLSIRSFHISTSSGGQDNPIAYGPGSIINGSLQIILDKPIQKNYGSVRVIFKCIEEATKSEPVTLFSVATTICSLSEGSAVLLQNGAHMFLFAIRLPQVNYPPSMHHSFFGRRIHYTLTGVIEPASSVGKPIFTETVPVLYLPLVVYNESNAGSTLSITQQRRNFSHNGHNITVAAELVKPAYCPGDVCTIKMTTNDLVTTAKIKYIQVSFVEVMTTFTPTMEQKQHQRHTLLTETFFVGNPGKKNSKSNKDAADEDHQDIFKFDLPRSIVPTFTTNMAGRYMDIKYEVLVTIPALNQQPSLHLFTSNNTVSTNSQQSSTANNASIILPVKIITVPPEYPVGVTVAPTDEEAFISETATANGLELPTFIPNIESPLPSPVHYPTLDRAYSVSPSNSFQLTEDDIDMDGDEDTLFGRTINNDSSIQDASGHLMVPEITGGRRQQTSPANAVEPTTVS